ncbi:MAG: O-antigen ligase family protein [Ignavibacteriaceae bacterium]
MKIRNIIYLLPIAALAAGARAFPLFEKVYYILPVLLAYFILLGSKEIQLNKHLRIIVLLLLLFSVWCLITSLWSSYPLITITRSLYFALISIGSVIGSHLYLKTKNGLGLNFLLPLNIFIVLLSLISLIFKIPGDAWSGGNGMGFMGFASHQNTLGALILFTIPASMLEVIKEFKNKAVVNADYKVHSKFKIQNSKFLLLLLIFNFSFLILTHSRASILSFLLMTGIILYNLINLKFFLILTSVFCLLTSAIYFFPATHKAAHELFFKNETFFGDHRYFMYEDSFKAALNGGLIGLGYGISDPNIHNNANGSHYENGRYIREKGNSTLAIVEETGIVGLILFLLPIGYVLSKFKIQNSKFKTEHQYSVSSNQNLESSIHHNLSILILSFLIAFLFHGQFEAWWVGVGSIQLPLFFMYFGLSVAAISNP